MSTEIDHQTYELPTHMSEAVNNLREAYKYAAVAKALLDIEPNNDPRLLTIADGIISIVSQIDGVTVEPITTTATVPFTVDAETASTNGNGHRDNAQADDKSDQIAPDETNDGTDTLEPDAPKEIASSVVVESADLTEPTEPEVPTRVPAVAEDATLGATTSERKTFKEITEDGHVRPSLSSPVERESDIEPEFIIDIIGDNTILVNGVTVALSPLQVVVLSSLLENRNELTRSAVLNPDAIKTFPGGIRYLKEKITAAGLDGDSFILKKGPRFNTEWQINPIFDFQDKREEASDPEAEQIDPTIGTVGNLALDGAQQAAEGAPEVSAESDTEHHESAISPEVVEPPKLTFIEDVSSAKERRKCLVTITNLEQLNEWVDKKNPYNDLPYIEIVADNKIMVNGKEQSLSPDQVEMLNILLSAYGESLTQSNILERGFAEFMSTGKRIETFRSSFNRLSSLLINDDRDPLVLGDLLNGRGFKCSDLMRIVDSRPEIKKK